MTDLENDLEQTVLNNFIDKNKFMNTGNLSANLILNESRANNVYRILKMELASCKSFTFAVAFITHSGLSQFLSVLADLNKQGIRGRILTSTYLYFNKPEVFRALKRIPNIETRIFEEKNCSTNEQIPFHAKGYLFEHNGYRSAIVGSSNLTSNALLQNYEWNLSVNSLDNAKITEQITLQINEEWNKAQTLNETWYQKYKKDYDQYHQTHDVDETEVAEGKSNKIVPNRMQKVALDQLISLRQNNKDKALIISATGTGKTYLGALDVAQYRPKRFLYVAHREQILKKSRISFYRVIGGNLQDYGIYSGTNQEGLHTKYVFATVQTLERNLNKFSPDSFDYILFDEAHHLGAATQQKIFNYFKPKFCLGMTATPERSDDFNIYKLFNYNVAYEIRLQQALEDKMLCPFHYYGVEDYMYHNEMINDASSLDHLVNDERVKYLIEQTKYYGYSGHTLHGLIFCSRNDEAEELAKKLSKRGYPSIHLSGEDNINKRETVVKKLEEGKIKYITTVDVFNEGIDIPCINQIVLLRSTQSSTIFIQQLGRGLRKDADKDYLTVIDFIGNYNNNYLIPIALTGDKSHSKDHVRDRMGLEPIYGLSIVNFTQIAKEQIYHAINRTNLTLKRKLYKEYQNEKLKLGRIPLMYDLQVDSIDCEVIAEKYKNYADFLTEMGETAYKISNYAKKILSFVTVVLANGKRRHELLLLNALINNNRLNENEYINLLRKNNCIVSKSVLDSVDAILSLSFFERKSLPNKNSYGGRALVIHEKGEYHLDKLLCHELESLDFNNLLRDAINTGLFRAKKYKSNQIFTLNRRYTRNDVARLLNWSKIVPGTNIGGYKFDLNNLNCPIFITYDKNKDLTTLNYPDQFINQSLINMASKYPRRLNSAEIQNFKNSKVTFYLFVKKSDDDGKSFIYLGTVKPQIATFKQRFIKKFDKQNKVKKVPIVTMNLQLNTPVELDEYYMLTKLKY